MTDKELFAFVLMPFKEDFDDVYKFGIKAPAANLGIKAERVDEQIYNQVILERIYQQIDIADIIIADMTGQNPNVFYEVGYAHAKDKLCILLTSNSNDIPFDLKHRRHIIYNNSIKGLSEQITLELKWAREEIERNNKSHITVTLKSAYGTLDKTKYAAYADIDFKIDMENKTLESSPEIEAAYLYTGENWTLKQDGNECGQKDSDIKPYIYRHFLNAPVKRLQKGQWAQLSFSGRKLLASTFKNQELKDNYRINGHALLRIVTTKGTFDYKIPVDLEVDEIPF